MDYRCGTWQPSETSKKWPTFDASSYDTSCTHGDLQETTIQGKREKWNVKHVYIQKKKKKKYHTNIQKSRKPIR